MVKTAFDGGRSHYPAGSVDAGGKAFTPTQSTEIGHPHAVGTCYKGVKGLVFDSGLSHYTTGVVDASS